MNLYDEIDKLVERGDEAEINRLRTRLEARAMQIAHDGNRGMCVRCQLQTPPANTADFGDLLCLD